MIFLRRYILIVVLFFFSLYSCSKKNKLIPESELKSILVECAFAGSYAKNVLSADQLKDSVLVYDAILDKYGYTAMDVKYTVMELAKRKSSILSVLIDEAVKEISKKSIDAESRSKAYTEWNNRIREFSKEYILQRDQKIIYNNSDSLANLKFDIIADRNGDYEISYLYKIDTSDKNTIKNFYYKISDGDKIGRSNTGTKWLTTSADGKFYQLKHTITISNNQPHNPISLIRDSSKMSSFEFDLVYYGSSKVKILKPNMVFDSLSVVFYPPLKDYTDDYLMHLMNIESINNLNFVNNEKDSSAVHSGWIYSPQKRDSYIKR